MEDGRALSVLSLKEGVAQSVPRGFELFMCLKKLLLGQATTFGTYVLG